MVGISGTAAETEGCLHRHLGYSSWNSTPTGRGFDQHVGFMQGEEDYNAHTFCKSTCILNGDLHDPIVQSLIRYYTVWSGVVDGALLCGRPRRLAPADAR
jgi:hypothetical protein